MVRMGGGLGQGGNVTEPRGVAELGFSGGIWVIMGGDRAAFCHKRHVIHKNLGVLEQTGMSVLPELGWWWRPQ